MHPFVVEALLAFLPSADGHSSGRPFLGNPSSIHSFGREAEALIEAARESVRRTFHAPPSEWQVTFTSGGTEANQLAVYGRLQLALAEYAEGKGPRPKWVVSSAEHSCVLGLVEPLRREGAEVHLLPSLPSGAVDFEHSELSGATLLSVIGVGNETGIFQHDLTSHILSEPSSSLKHRPAYHSDFVAGWGKADLDLRRPDAPDFVAIAAHKLGGLSGCGALIHRKSLPLRPRIIGNQQGGLRGGTENLLGIVSLKAIADRWADLRGQIADLRSLRDRFERELLSRFPNVVITGHAGPRAPHLSHFRFPGMPKDLSLVPQLDLRGFAVSSGSACASHVIEPSHVMLALGLSRVDALNALRVSLHPGNRWEDLEQLLDALGAILDRQTRATVAKSAK